MDIRFRFLIVLIVFCKIGISQSELDVVPIRADYLWIKPTEVSNKEYRIFLDDLLEKGDTLAYHTYYPDTNKWNMEGSYNEPFVKYYFIHPAYADYPVVNVTYQGAVAYCDWLTNRVNVQNPNGEVLVRLPTEKEWEWAARGGKDFAIYPWGTEFVRSGEGKNKGKMQANFVRGKGDYMGIAGALNDAADITAPVKSYWKNPYGLYNMSGNAEELVAEKGITKGGSWKDRADYLRIDKRQYEDSASPEVGFRYVLEVVYKKLPKKLPKEVKLNNSFFNDYFVEVKDSILAGKYEVSNQLYSLFVKEMGVNYARNCEGWLGLFPYSQYWANNYATHPDFKDYPEVNVTHIQAIDFCEWLTKKYNELDNKKYKKVQFRLPTEEEWMMAASSNGVDYPFAMESKNLRDKKGNYLANFNPKLSDSENISNEDSVKLHHFFFNYFTDLQDFDGYAVTAPVDSYTKNSLGTFCMSGNVSEMTSDKKLIKGGSWADNIDFLQIQSAKSYNGFASPFVGFRVFMEVLEK